MNWLGDLLPLVLILLIGYLLLIRPARNRARATQQLQSALSRGDQVLLTSGIYATVLDVHDDRAEVELAPGVVVTVHRQAVGRIIVDVPADLEDADLAVDSESSWSPEQAADETEPNRGVN